MQESDSCTRAGRHKQEQKVKISPVSCLSRCIRTILKSVQWPRYGQHTSTAPSCYVPPVASTASRLCHPRQNDISTIDQLLTNPSYRILSDTFIRTYLQDCLMFLVVGSIESHLIWQDLLRNIRLQAPLGCFRDTD